MAADSSVEMGGRNALVNAKAKFIVCGRGYQLLMEKMMLLILEKWVKLSSFMTTLKVAD